VAEQLGGAVVVKAQVLVGGRGKAGGIKLAADPAEAEQHAAAILGMDIRGHTVRRVWVEQSSDIEREYYFSITFDRGEKRPLLMLTTAGGVEIEEVAATTPERLARLHLDPLVGFRIRHQLSPGHELVFRADVGGFDVGSQFSWNLMGAYSWDFAVRDGVTLSGLLGYRALSVDYAKGSGLSTYEYDVVMHGPIVGLMAKF
jgi:hypothetical protein